MDPGRPLASSPTRLGAKLSPCAGHHKPAPFAHLRPPASSLAELVGGHLWRLGPLRNTVFKLQTLEPPPPHGAVDPSGAVSLRARIRVNIAPGADSISAASNPRKHSFPRQANRDISGLHLGAREKHYFVWSTCSVLIMNILPAGRSAARRLRHDSSRTNVRHGHGRRLSRLEEAPSPA